MKTARIGLLLVAVMASGLLAQSAKPPIGTSLIVGRVVDGSTGAPVDEAIVGLDPAGRRPEDRNVVMADAQGRFVFREVPKGAYYVSASRVGFIQNQYGSPWPLAELLTTESFAPPVIEIGDNERITNLTIKLWKLASIGGRVVDQTGQPVVGVTVRALNKIVSGGRPALTFDTWSCSGACNIAKTDDRGVFRFGFLAPGEYVIVVPSVTSAAPTSLQRVLATSGSAEPPAVFQTSAGAMQWLGGGGNVVPVNAGIRGRDERIAIGDVDRGLPLAALTEDGQLFIYPTQFYPSATRLADAAMVRLSSGEVRSDVNFTLRPVKTVSVSGTLTGANGPFGDCVLRLIPTGQEILQAEPEVATTVSDADGSFTFVGVTAGDYVIRLRYAPRPAPGTATADPPRTQWADTRVSVAEADVRGVAVTTRELPRASGRVDFAGAAATPVGSAFLYSVVRADGRLTYPTGMTVAAQSSFTSGGLIPGAYLVQVFAAPLGWYFRSAVWNGRDVSQAPFDVTDADITGIVVTLSDKPLTALSGIVHSAASAPVASAVAIVFPVDTRQWTDNGKYPRGFAQTASNHSGVFSVTNLPPGDYWVAALADMEPVRWQDAASLAKIAQLATRVSLRENEPASVSLRPIRWPR